MAFSNRYVQFDGVDGYATAGNVLSVERTDVFSTSLWFKTRSTAGGYLLSKQLTSPSYRGYLDYIDTVGAITFSLRSDWAAANRLSVLTTSTGWNDAQWHHLVTTYDGSSTAAGCKIYIDGSPQTLTPVYNNLTATIVSTASFRLGASEAPSGFFAGDLDEVAVHNKVLTQAEVTWIRNGGVPRDLAGIGAPPNLVGWWRMGDGDTYPALLDSSGNAYHATMTLMASSDIKYGSPGSLGIDHIPDRYAGQVSLGGSDASYYALGGGGPGITTYYKMRAIDGGAAPPGYVTWVSTTPDFAGAGFSGGTPTPVGSMVSGSAVVAATWQE